jgi:hypothetical protein
MEGMALRIVQGEMPNSIEGVWGYAVGSGRCYFCMWQKLMVVDGSWFANAHRFVNWTANIANCEGRRWYGTYIRFYR